MVMKGRSTSLRRHEGTGWRLRTTMAAASAVHARSAMSAEEARRSSVATGARLQAMAMGRARSAWHARCGGQRHKGDKRWTPQSFCFARTRAVMNALVQLLGCATK
eukprot:6207985-Pleurochrysis_carterae.AAC.1